MTFVNRSQELAFLEKKYRSTQAELLILYGRRRVGKTELLLRFCEKKKSAYFLGRLESREDTLRRMNQLLIETFDDKKILNHPFTHWDQIFHYLAEQAQKNMVFIIDEFPFIVEKFPEVVSIVQDHWDSNLRHSSLTLILCGSSISMMEKYALDYKSPLYGRRTGQWKIDSLDVAHLKSFFPHYTIEELLQVYACLDTIPGYLVQFSPNKSVLHNIKEKILSKGEFLYEEVEILLREELRDPSNYMSILSSIAGGLTTFNEIWQRTRLDKSLLSKYLHVLEKVGITERIIPVTESHKKRLKYKGALYVLKDNFFNFWFQFVYVNATAIERGNLNFTTINRQFQQYLGIVFERFIVAILPFLNLGRFTRAGRWWHKDKEIDIVALNEETKHILFGECKWQEHVHAEKIISSLHHKTAFVQWHNNERKESYAVFAKQFQKKIKRWEGKRVYCYDLNDLNQALVS